MFRVATDQGIVVGVEEHEGHLDAGLLEFLDVGLEFG